MFEDIHKENTEAEAIDFDNCPQCGSYVHKSCILTNEMVKKINGLCQQYLDKDILLAKYQKLGTPEDIQWIINELTDLQKVFNQLGDHHKSDHHPEEEIS